MADKPTEAAVAVDEPAASPTAPPRASRQRHPLLALLRNIGLYLALLAGAAAVLGGTSFAARALGFDFDGSRFGRLLMLGVYAIAAITMLLRFGGGGGGSGGGGGGEVG